MEMQNLMINNSTTVEAVVGRKREIGKLKHHFMAVATSTLPEL
jgi:hypothetical protein